jgi:hypothetical protein
MNIFFTKSVSTARTLDLNRLTKRFSEHGTQQQEFEFTEFNGIRLREIKNKTLVNSFQL